MQEVKLPARPRDPLSGDESAPGAARHARGARIELLLGTEPRARRHAAHAALRHGQRDPAFERLERGRCRTPHAQSAVITTCCACRSKKRKSAIAADLPCKLARAMRIFVLRFKRDAWRIRVFAHHSNPAKHSGNYACARSSRTITVQVAGG